MITIRITKTETTIMTLGLITQTISKGTGVITGPETAVTATPKTEDIEVPVLAESIGLSTIVSRCIRRGPPSRLALVILVGVLVAW